MEGHIGNEINFPGWLGKNSKRSKFQRMLSEIQTHMRTRSENIQINYKEIFYAAFFVVRISGGKLAVNLDYLKPLRDKIITPLIKRKNEGIEEAVSVMNSYQLLREDLDSIIELSLWKGQQNPLNLIDSKVRLNSLPLSFTYFFFYFKVKAAFTRAYNKEAPLLPFAVANVQKKKAGSGDVEGIEEEGDVDEDEEEEEDDITKDAMIKV